MTESKAINDIRNRECIECIGNEIGCGSCAYKMAIDALEKQIPKKPIFSDDKQFALCPCCDMKGLTDKQEYCDDCGQAIDWNDKE